MSSGLTSSHHMAIFPKQASSSCCVSLTIGMGQKSITSLPHEIVQVGVTNGVGIPMGDQLNGYPLNKL